MLWPCYIHALYNNNCCYSMIVGTLQYSGICTYRSSMREISRSLWRDIQMEFSVYKYKNTKQ